MKHLILDIIKDIISTFVFYFGVVYFGCKAFGNNPFDLKFFIILFIMLFSICIIFDVIDYLHNKRETSHLGDSLKQSIESEVQDEKDI